MSESVDLLRRSLIGEAKTYAGLALLGYVLFYYSELYDALEFIFYEWRYSVTYSHGFLALICAAALVFLRSREKPEDASVGNVSRFQRYLFAAALFAVAFVTAKFATDLKFHSLGIASLVFFACTAIVLNASSNLWRRFTPLLLILTALPLPMEEELTWRLQQFSAVTVYGIFDLNGFHVSLTGAVLRIESHELLVGPACAGLNSILALLFFAGFLTLIVRRKWWLKILMLLLVVPVALGANVLRICALAMYAVHIDYGEAIALWHPYGGILFYLTSAIFYIALVASPLGRIETQEPNSKPPVKNVARAYRL
ncbi:MAG: exosortase/archaeosortase family protein [Planctomycetes bacterium]|nr:exosortase/archaeosortase family protein [Planctomycetota bacterium]